MSCISHLQAVEHIREAEGLAAVSLCEAPAGCVATDMSWKTHSFFTLHQFRLKIEVVISREAAFAENAGIYCSLVVRQAVEESCLLLPALGGSSQEKPPGCLLLPLLTPRSFCFSSSHGHLKAPCCLSGAQLLLGPPMAHAKAVQLPLPTRSPPVPHEHPCPRGWMCATAQASAPSLPIPVSRRALQPGAERLVRVPGCKAWAGSGVMAFTVQDP